MTNEHVQKFQQFHSKAALKPFHLILVLLEFLLIRNFSSNFHYRSTMVCKFDLAAKQVICTVNVRRVGSTKVTQVPWTATVGVVAVGDQFSPHLHHVFGDVAEGFTFVPNGTALNVQSYSVSVPADEDKFELTLHVALGSLSETVMRRLRLNHTLNVKEIK